MTWVGLFAEVSLKYFKKASEPGLEWDDRTRITSMVLFLGREPENELTNTRFTGNTRAK
jgi:hypothetical protein